jgi:hypothetical protein
MRKRLGQWLRLRWGAEETGPARAALTREERAERERVLARRWERMKHADGKK